MSRGSGMPPAKGVGAEDGVPHQGEIIASKYKVERVLGSGGMGVVLAARHIQLGQNVAIKFMRGEAVGDATAVGRFLYEARAVAALSSEHVVKVLDVGTLDTGAPYIVLEYLDGLDLGDVLRRHGPMAVPVVIGAILQACEALAEAHAIGIVHRDLKPSNLFVTNRKDGTPLVKVLDFGISKATGLNKVATSENLTASGYIMGSPAYMSPEQVRSAKAADARSDIWSLGVILYELLTGTAPFAGETMGETFAKIVSETPPPLRRSRPDIAEGLAAVVMRCLERDIHRRIQSVADLASKLSPFAPPEAALSVERIRRMAHAFGGTLTASETLDAPPALRPLPFAGRGAADSSPPEGPTEASWLRSQARPPLTSAPAWAFALAIVAAIALTTSLGIYVLRPAGDHPASPKAQTPPATSSALAVAPVRAIERAVLEAPPEEANAREVSAPLDADASWQKRRETGGRERGPAPRVRTTVRSTAAPTGDPGLDDLLQQRE